MDPAAEFATTVVWELRLIHWLLIALLLLAGFLVLLLFSAFRGLMRSLAMIKTDQDTKSFQQDMEDLLTKGMGKEAFFAATEALPGRPRDPYVHWYLGRANFQLEKYVEAKRAFSTVAEIAPDWAKTVEPWLERVEQEIRNASPKVVQ
jgi:hypothetical protein